MRPSRTVARAALTALLAIGALPGLVGSHEPSLSQSIAAALFHQVNLATHDQPGIGELIPDTAGRSAAALGEGDTFSEPALDASGPADGRAQAGRAAKASWSWKPAKYTVGGVATFYDNGTTAMRLPRGTTVVICGAGACIERVITDYGPMAAGGRLVDLYRPDFFRICGCGWWSGTTQVTVRVY
jgi:hypothetical protein